MEFIIQLYLQTTVGQKYKQVHFQFKAWVPKDSPEPTYGSIYQLQIPYGNRTWDTGTGFYEHTHWSQGSLTHDHNVAITPTLKGQSGHKLLDKLNLKNWATFWHDKSPNPKCTFQCYVFISLMYSVFELNALCPAPTHLYITYKLTSSVSLAFPTSTLQPLRFLRNK